MPNIWDTSNFILKRLSAQCAHTRITRSIALSGPLQWSIAGMRSVNLYICRVWLNLLHVYSEEVLYLFVRYCVHLESCIIWWLPPDDCRFRIVIIIIISRVLQSLYIPAIWLRRHPLCGVDSVHLQILLIGTCRLCVRGLSLATITGRWLGVTPCICAR